MELSMNEAALVERRGNVALITTTGPMRATPSTAR
jgi:hypothetical protein